MLIWDKMKLIISYKSLERALEVCGLVSFSRSCCAFHHTHSSTREDVRFDMLPLLYLVFVFVRIHTCTLRQAKRRARIPAAVQVLAPLCYEVCLVTVLLFDQDGVTSSQELSS